MSRGAMVRSQESSDAATRHTPRRAVVGTGHGAAGQAGDQPGVERGFADATAAGCHGDLTERHPVLPRPADRADLDLGYRGQPNHPAGNHRRGVSRRVRVSPRLIELGERVGDGVRAAGGLLAAGPRRTHEPRGPDDLRALGAQLARVPKQRLVPQRWVYEARKRHIMPQARAKGARG
jgi:hypothetical protein